jgi:hypothetical protein
VLELVAALATGLSSSTTALSWVARLIGLAVLVASVELGRSWARTVGPAGLLPWSIVRREHERLPRPLRAALDALLGERGFVVVVAVRIAAAFALVVDPAGARPAAGIAFAASLLVSVRFRGRENGASDAMTNLVLLALCIASVGAVVGVGVDVDVEQLAVGFVAAQALLSYVAAGLAKLRSPSWRRGTALAAFVSVERFGVPQTLRRVLAQPIIGAVAGFVVVAWQLASPLALTSTWAAVSFCVVGLFFHAANFVAFGLNRFVFAWAATYPAIVWCATRLAG